MFKRECQPPRHFLRISFVAVFFGASAYGAGSDSIDFSRDIRPLLSNHCYKCHGPDAEQRQADFRLDDATAVFAADGIVVPGKPDESELVRRIESDDPEERMPPGDAKLDLNPDQVRLIRHWVEQGASWQQHWSFVAPRRPQLPQVAAKSFVKNPIDFFVVDRLSREGLKPSPPADKTTLIRRVTFDLTGLPPTPEETDAFLNDRSPDAYERVVDRLLQSPRFGERMALVWLDAARYADTSGYQNDGPRSMWRWRDWVIEAYNRGLAFDQFTLDQIAGDLLPDPTLEQRIATGFNRNHRGNSEGGVIAEEFQVEYVVDRVETTATVWLGLTLGCGRCHDHKYDPISQREFYQFYAFFNNIPEYGRALKEGNSPPYVAAPTREQQRQLRRLEELLSAAQQRFAAQQKALERAQSSWETTLSTEAELDWSIEEGLVAHFALDEVELLPDTDPEITISDGTLGFVKGIKSQAVELDGKQFIAASKVGEFGYFDRFSLAAWIRPTGDHGGTILSRMTDVPRGDGYYVQLLDGKVHVNLVKRWLDDSTRVESLASVPTDEWTHVLVTYDGSRRADGITIYLNGQAVSHRANLDLINQSFASKEPFRIGGGGGPDGRFVGLIDDVRVYDRCLPPDAVEIVATPESIRDIATTAADQRTEAQQAKLRTYFLSHHAPRDIGRTYRELLALRQRKDKLTESFPTVMVMEEMPERRATHILTRGEYDKPGQSVTPGVPSILPELSQAERPARLSLAHWLVDDRNPLTARVAVNRYWQIYFGTGIVGTTEDFGSQGSQPTHPKLLDWMATEFIRRQWDVKAMQRLIVTSATYRQSARVPAELLERDPENQLLARGPRFRLSAEMVRDQALAASGLLVEQLGGPSIKPYQPGDLWQDIATDSDYVQDHGADLYRRSLYIYWKRTVVPPSMATFDAPAREMCSVRPRRTNTPLQALTLMNDLTFVEAARVLAQRVLAAEHSSTDDHLRHLFRLVLSRPPTEVELDVLRDGFNQHLADFQSDPEVALQLADSGEYPRPTDYDVVEVAALTTVASMILNLDETVTKQ